MNEKYCNCDIDAALYNDMGKIKCSYCGGIVNEERAKKFIEYNTPKENTNDKTKNK
ncbi:MAG: hypothetical protein PHW73_01765 [Atribacterota bacterium]|nr:hypothetical protein [Atribacterota bacterium]